MTPQQLRLLRFISGYIAANGAPPTLREMTPSLGVKNRSNVFDHLVALEREGWIARDHRRRRGLSILRQPPETDDTSALAFAAPALLEAVELQARLIARMRAERHFPVFGSDVVLLETATKAVERALALAQPIPPTPSAPEDSTGDHAHA